MPDDNGFPQSPISIADFAKKVKEKYPNTLDFDDLEVTRRFVSRFPEYRQVVDLPDVTPEEIEAKAQEFGLKKTSGYRSYANQLALYKAGKTNTLNSYHQKGQAFDFGGDKEKMAEFANWARDVYSYSSPEIIHGEGSHKNHVHIAFNPKAKPSEAAPGAPAKGLKPEEGMRLWQSFNAKKEAGDINGAVEEMQKLKPYGFEVGIGDGNFPYVKPPAPYQKAMDSASLKAIDQKLGELGKLQKEAIARGDQLDPNSGLGQMITQLSRQKNDLLLKQAGRPGFEAPITRGTGYQVEAPRNLYERIARNPWVASPVMAGIGGVEDLLVGAARAATGKPYGGEKTKEEQVADALYQQNLEKDLGEGIGPGVYKFASGLVRGAPVIGGYGLGGPLGGAIAGGLQAAGAPEQPDIKDVGLSAVLSAIPPFAGGPVERVAKGFVAGAAPAILAGKSLEESAKIGALPAIISGLFGKQAPRKAVAPEPIAQVRTAGPLRAEPVKYEIVDGSGKVIGDAPTIAEAGKIIEDSGQQGWKIRTSPIKSPEIPEFQRGPIRPPGENFTEPQQPSRLVDERGRLIERPETPTPIVQPDGSVRVEQVGPREGIPARPEIIGQPGLRLQGPIRRPQGIEPLAIPEPPLPTRRLGPGQYEVGPSSLDPAAISAAERIQSNQWFRNDATGALTRLQEGIGGKPGMRPSRSPDDLVSALQKMKAKQEAPPTPAETGGQVLDILAEREAMRSTGQPQVLTGTGSDLARAMKNLMKRAEGEKAKPDWVDAAEKRQRSRLEGGTLSANPFAAMADEAIIMGHKLYRAGQSFAEWARGMAEHFGPRFEQIRGRLNEIWGRLSTGTEVMPRAAENLWSKIFSSRPQDQAAGFTYKPRANTIYANPKGQQLVNQVAKEAYPQSELSGTSGFTVEPGVAKRLADTAEQMAKAESNPSRQQLLLDLAGQMRQSTESGPLIIQRMMPESFMSGRTTARHERIHQADLLMKAAAGGRSPRIADIKVLPHFDKISESLTKNPVYKDMGPQQMAMEGAAYIGTGEHGRFGLTVEEGAEFLKAYFDTVAKTYGPKWLDTYHSVAGVAKETLENAKRTGIEGATARRPGQPGAARPDLSGRGSSSALEGTAFSPRTEGEVSGIGEAVLKGLAKFYGAGSQIMRPVRWLDSLIQPSTAKIDATIRKSLGNLIPESAKPYLSTNVEVKNLVTEGLHLSAQNYATLSGLVKKVKGLTPKRTGFLNMFKAPSAPTEELLVADRIARGVPADLSRFSPEVQAKITDIAGDVKTLAQELTAQRAALGLPVREEWMHGMQYWYPNIFPKKGNFLANIGGAFFSKIMPEARLSQAEQARVFGPRTSDRFAVFGTDGKLATMKDGSKAVFRTRAEADEAAKGLQRYAVQFYDKGEPRRGNRQEVDFDSIKERERWIDENAGPDGSVDVVRTIDPKQQFKVVEPMTHEAAVAKGLLEDININLRKGFSQEMETVNRVRTLTEMGKRLAVDSPQEGYVKLSDMGFKVPEKFARANPHIERLANGYVPKDVAVSMVAFYGKNGPVARAFSGFEQALRKGITVYNPARHARQIIENEFMLGLSLPDASVNAPFRAKSARTFFDGVTGKSDNPIWKEYSQNVELMSSDLVHGEFERFWDHIDPTKINEENQSLLGALKDGIGESQIGKMINGVGKWAQERYIFEDQVYKFQAYHYAREVLGKSPEEASALAKRSFFDYYDVPPIVAKVNRYVPFTVNTTYQLSRIIQNHLKERPLETLTKLGLLGGMYDLTRDKLMEMSGITPDDLKKMGPLAPKYWELILPITDKGGRNLSLNLNWLWLFGEVLQSASTFRDRPFGDWFHQTARKAIPLTFQPLVTAISERDPFGRPLVSETEKKTVTKGEEARRIVETSVKGWMPWIAAQAWDKAYLRMDEGEAKQQGLGTQLLETVTGAITPVDVEGRQALRTQLETSGRRALVEQANTERGKVLRGEMSGEAMSKKAEALKSRSTQEKIAPANLEKVVEEIEKAEKGEPHQAAELFKGLVESGQYPSQEEAVKAVREQFNTRRRLTEMGNIPEQSYGVLQKVAEEAAEKGGLEPGTREALMKILEPMAEADRDALLEKVREKIEQLKARAKRQGAN